MIRQERRLLPCLSQVWAGHESALETTAASPRRRCRLPRRARLRDLLDPTHPLVEAIAPLHRQGSALTSRRYRRRRNRRTDIALPQGAEGITRLRPVRTSQRPVRRYGIQGGGIVVVRRPRSSKADLGLKADSMEDRRTLPLLLISSSSRNRRGWEHHRRGRSRRASCHLNSISNIHSSISIHGSSRLLDSRLQV